MGKIIQRGAPYHCGVALAAFFMFTQTPAAYADADADKAAISARLQHWADAFNNRDATAVCDLFAPGLIATIRGAARRGTLERDHAALCAHLATVLANPNQRWHYTPDIREIIVSGDLAVVRVVWTLTVEDSSSSHTSQEPGLDVFRRQPDGSWAIIRFLAFSTDPD